MNQKRITPEYLERMPKKMAGWKAKSLSFAGRVELGRSVLTSMPQFVLSNGWVPKSVMEHMEVEIRESFWSNADNRSAYGVMGVDV